MKSGKKNFLLICAAIVAVSTVSSFAQSTESVGKQFIFNQENAKQSIAKICVDTQKSNACETWKFALVTQSVGSPDQIELLNKKVFSRESLLKQTAKLLSEVHDTQDVRYFGELKDYKESAYSQMGDNGEDMLLVLLGALEAPSVPIRNVIGRWHRRHDLQRLEKFDQENLSLKQSRFIRIQELIKTL